MKFTISTFSGGMNTLMDPRVIAPTQEGQPAETPDTQNMDIISNGAIITSPGFSLKSSISSTGGTDEIMVYDKDASTRYLVVSNLDHYYYMTPSSFTWTDIGDYGIQATRLGGTNFRGTNSIVRAILGTNGGTTIGTFTVTIASPGVFTHVAHGLSAGDIVYFTTTGALPTGLSPRTPYYVIAAGLTADAFEVSLTSGGSAVNTSGSQSGTHTLYTSNKIYKWDGVNFTQLGGSPPMGYIMESFMGFLFIAFGSTLYYSAIENEDNWTGGAINFPHDITGLKADGQILQVHTYRESFTVQFFYNDSFSLSTPLKQPFKNASGCWSHKSLTTVFNDTYYLSQVGIQKFGADPNFLQSGLRVNSLSWKITPSLQSSQINMANVDKSCGVFFNKKYFCSIPYGGSTNPSKTFVYNWDYDAWTTRTGFYPSGFAVFADSNNQDDLYFASAISPELYKFDNQFSYNGSDYTRYWTSKIFNFGSSVIQKKFNYIDFAGAMFSNTTFFVDITVDGTTVTYKIDNNNLLQTSTGGYYGDDYYGNLFYGGGSSSGFYRYGARLYFTPAITEGREMSFKVYNSAAGEPFSVDMAQIDFEPLSTIQIPEGAQIDQLA